MYYYISGNILYNVLHSMYYALSMLCFGDCGPGIIYMLLCYYDVPRLDIITSGRDQIRYQVSRLDII